MTAATWALRDVGLERTLADLRRRFPGVCLWRGEHTGRFWALVRHAGHDRLVEAASPDALAWCLADLHPQPVVPPYTRRSPHTGMAERAKPSTFQGTRTAGITPVHGRTRRRRRKTPARGGLWRRVFGAAMVVGR